MSGDGMGFTDVHSHLVPGVDDGARDLDEAREALARFWKAGVRRLATTPHLDGSLTLTPERLEARVQAVEEAWLRLQEAAEEDLPELELRRGFEVMLDAPGVDLTLPSLALGGTASVLVEWPRLRVPPETIPVLTRIRASGVRPVLAHPERYRGLGPDLTLPGEWRRAGAHLQVNYGSLLGRYGEEPRERAMTLLERGWVDLFSSDHHARPRLPLYLREVRELLVEMEGEEHFQILAGTNPSRILDGEEPVPVPPLEVSRGIWSRLRSILSGG
jgi:protein-tyrosine phosphatase